MIIAEGTQFGPYRLLEKIGAGGMGEVYRVLDTRLEREVALKLVSESYLAIDVGSGSPAGVPLPHDTPGQATPHSGSHLSHERFLREARSAATLNHPNVCAIYDTGEQDGRPYLVMELLRGETLKQYLAKAGGHGLAADEVVAFAQQAAAALAAAHAKRHYPPGYQTGEPVCHRCRARQAPNQDSRLRSGEEAGWGRGRRLTRRRQAGQWQLG